MCAGTGLGRQVWHDRKRGNPGLSKSGETNCWIDQVTYIALHCLESWGPHLSLQVALQGPQYFQAL